MGKRKKVNCQFLVLIVIVCFLLSLMLFFIFDISSSTINLTNVNTKKEITLQEVEKLKREGLTAEDLEKLLKDYDKKRNK